MLKIKFTSAVLVFNALFMAAYAQNTVDNSVYSRFGLGDIVVNETLQTAAQGGTSTAWSSYNSLNSTNPAALGSLTLTEYSLGLYAKYGMLRTATESGTTLGGNINHLSLAVPIFNPINEIGVKKKRSWRWGVGLGLRPYSQVAYTIFTDTQEDGATVTRSFKGQGGLYQLNIDNGFKWKNISGGISAQYLFGKSVYTRRTFYSDSVPAFSNTNSPLQTAYVDDISYSGLGIKIGGQYDYLITKQGTEAAEDFRRRDKLHAIIGATFAPTFNMDAINSFSRSRVLVINGSTVVQNITEGTNNGSTVMPSSYSVGLRLVKDNNWQAAVQYDLKNWAEYSNSERPEALTSTYALRVGGEWTPNYKSFTSYPARMSYRLGAYKATDPRVVRGTQLETNAITFGLGMPIRMPRGAFSHCNLNFEIGEQGTTRAVSEFYTKMTLGFTLNDNLWFARPKYN